MDYLDWGECGPPDDLADRAERIARERNRAERAWAARERRARQIGPCPCECNRGGFCGGCGHAGCGGRR